VLADPLVDPPPAALLLLLLLQPATASEPTAAMARTRRPFTGYASIPGLSHDEEVGIIAAPSGADWPNAPRIGRLRDLAPERHDRADSICPPQWPKFVKLIKPSQFGRRQEG
jgi:hypothetical protein